MIFFSFMLPFLYLFRLKPLPEHTSTKHVTPTSTNSTTPPSPSTRFLRWTLIRTWGLREELTDAQDPGAKVWREETRLSGGKWRTIFWAGNPVPPRTSGTTIPTATTEAMTVADTGPEEEECAVARAQFGAADFGTARTTDPDPQIARRRRGPEDGVGSEEAVRLRHLLCGTRKP